MMAGDDRIAPRCAVVVPVTVAPGQDTALLARTLVSLRREGAAGVVLAGAGVTATLSPALAERADGPRFEVWIAAELLSDVSPTVAVCSALPCTGLVLLAPPPEGETMPHAELAPLLARRRAGEALAQRVRDVRRALVPARRLAVCLPLVNSRAETSRGLCLDVDSLIRDGTITTVVYSGNPAWNCHRARLLTDRPLAVGVSVPDGKPGELQSAVALACSNPTLDALWLWDPDAVRGLALVRDTMAAREAAARLEAGLAEALAAGRATALLEVPEKRGNNQASVHGVAQSFTPAAATACTAVQVYAALRLRGDAVPAPLRVELRDDAGGKPGAKVLAAGAVPAPTFGHEPAYRWGTVCFDPAPTLTAGQRYWVYLPANDVYIWRLVSDGAGPNSQAWSSRYDYTKHGWVLRVICEARTP